MWQTMLVGIVVSVSVLTIGFGLILVNLAGGIDDLFDGDGPQENDPEVVAAREQASRDLALESDRLIAATLQPALGGVAQPVHTVENESSCDVGQQNWKIRDDFHLACDLSRTGIVAVPRRASFRDDMVALDSALMADGWVVEGLFGLDRVLTDYWDDRAPIGTGYSMDNLPDAGYSRQVGGQRVTLSIGWAEADSPATAITYDGSDVSDLLAAIPTDGYALVVTESTEYFRE